ncbi:MAG: SDR family NAD(P)-dependent oxidoreductase, partial [Rhodobacterales bacterium]|nr:SDR family NAD(P)-dependent oxidoreductase [Rhodobacterales bacterium]
MDGHGCPRSCGSGRGPARWRLGERYSNPTPVRPAQMRYTGAMAPRDETPSCILITGASSGIGAALAAAYAAPGRHLVLTGRSAERLDAVARACRDRGATVAARALDVTDGPAMADWIGTLDDARPLDLVIANAGISAG